MMLRQLTHIIGDKLPVLMPPSKEKWGAAMRNELDSIANPANALKFAMGCIWACFNERMKEMEFKLKMGRYAIIAALLALAVVASASLSNVFTAHAPSGLVFASLGIAFAATAFWTFLRGAEALVQAASSMLILNLMAFATLSSTSVGDDVWVNLELYRALAIEGIAIWGSLLLGGIALWWLPNSKYARQG